jgi:hypothetical protein
MATIGAKWRHLAAIGGSLNFFFLLFFVKTKILKSVLSLSKKGIF